MSPLFDKDHFFEVLTKHLELKDREYPLTSDRCEESSAQSDGPGHNKVDWVSGELHHQCPVFLRSHISLARPAYDLVAATLEEFHALLGFTFLSFLLPFVALHHDLTIFTGI
jgi:hypothetical protein